MDRSKIYFTEDTTKLNSDNLVQLWNRAGWIGLSDKYPERLLEAIKRSDYVVTAWIENSLIGIVTTLSNGLHTYVTHLAVDKAYQNIDIGSTLIGYVKERYADCQIILYTRNAGDFYMKQGFEPDKSITLLRINNLKF